MQNDLVFTQGQNILTDSIIISEKIGIAHRHILESIRKLIIQSAETSADIKDYIFKESTFKDDKNREFPKFVLNKPAFSLLMMRLSGKKVLKWQIEFNNAFYEMERLLLQQQNASWIQTRIEGKQERLRETDIIKTFIEYAKKQGSTKSEWYYGLITNMTYKALELVGHNQPIRETLNKMGLADLAMAERKIQASLKKGIDKGLHYKEIYLLAKQELEDLAKLMPKFEPMQLSLY